ncbi:phosphatidylserine decarboxylase family protein [Candidatus Dependentiae bacterium]|nr:phosphatidylserine decarboxylase family protein [Candidatus Dependentiae bacterium]
MLEIVTHNLLWTEGIYVLVAGLLLAGLAYYLNRWLFMLALAFLAFSFFFFRNPDRVCAQAQADSNILICPAQGIVVGVDQSEEPEFDGFSQRVSIFLSPLDVHVNWTPCAGTIQEVTYRPGRFIMAFVPKSSELNERMDITIKDDQGRVLLVRQIAGMVARRIICWVKPGDRVTAGQKYGMIRFGSRVDILLPKNCEIAVKAGDYVYGGQQVLGRWL